MSKAKKYNDWYESNIRRKWQTAVFVFVTAVPIVFALCVSGCKTCVPIVEIRDSVRLEYKHDSIYEYKHDSIFRDRWRDGDTVFINVEHWAIRWKDKIVEVHDTIRTEQKEVEQVKVVPSFYKGCTIALWILVALAIVVIVIRIIIKIYLKR